MVINMAMGFVCRGNKRIEPVTAVAHRNSEKGGSGDKGVVLGEGRGANGEEGGERERGRGSYTKHGWWMLSPKLANVDCRSRARSCLPSSQMETKSPQWYKLTATERGQVDTLQADETLSSLVLR